MIDKIKLPIDFVRYHLHPTTAVLDRAEGGDGMRQARRQFESPSRVTKHGSPKTHMNATAIASLRRIF